MIKNILTFIASIGVSLAAGGLGALATTPNIPTWYATLDKPLLNPPSWIFGPVWTTLYILMGIALYLVIRSQVKGAKRDAYVTFGLQLALNTLWSVAFFGVKSPEAGIAIILLLLTAIIITILKFKPFSNAAAWLLAPYLAWVSFATYLTIAIAILN